MAMHNDLNAEVKADLVGFSSAVDGVAYIVEGDTTRGDSNVRFYYYDSSSSLTADGENILAATGMGGTGRFIKLPTPSSYSRSITDGVTRSLTTSTGATGFQVSASKASTVTYSVLITTTSTLSGNSDGSVVLEVAPTNSSTPSDWVKKAVFRNGQNNTLIVGLTLNQTMEGILHGDVPAGYYVKLRTISNSGSPTFTYDTGSETTIG